jgi:hypothetical protein
VLHAGLVNERALERWLAAAGQDPWRLEVALVLACSTWAWLNLFCGSMIEIRSHLLWQQAARVLLASEQPEAALDAVLALAVQQALEVEAEEGCAEAVRGGCDGQNAAAAWAAPACSACEDSQRRRRLLLVQALLSGGQLGRPRRRALACMLNGSSRQLHLGLLLPLEPTADHMPRPALPAPAGPQQGPTWWRA